MKSLTSPFEFDRLNTPIDNGCGSPYKNKCGGFRSLDPNFGRTVNDKVTNPRERQVKESLRKAKLKKPKTVKTPKATIPGVPSLRNNIYASIDFASIPQ